MGSFPTTSTWYNCSMKNNKVTESRKGLIKEHEGLVKVLRKGDKKALLKEAIKQAKELLEYRKGGNDKDLE